MKIKVLKVVDLLHQLTALCNEKGLANSPVYMESDEDGVLLRVYGTEVIDTNTVSHEWESDGKAVVIKKVKL